MSVRLGPVSGAALAATWIAIACTSGDGASDAGACTPNLESIEQTIFRPKCASCHGEGDAAAGLTLVGPALATTLSEPRLSCGTTRPLVAPGNANGSQLVRKLVERPPPCGETMPPGASLSADEVSCIRRWIVSIVDASADAPTAGTKCLPEQASCGGQCVDLRTNPDHCGACSSACSSGLACEAEPSDAGVAVAQCVATCRAGLVKLGRVCVDPMSDPAHCGPSLSSCDLEKGEACTAGACGCAAKPGFAAEVEPIFTAAGCTSMGCHRGQAGGAAANLDLRVGFAHADLVGVASRCLVPRVTPGSVGKSALIGKVELAPACGGVMPPLDRPPLSAPSRAILRAWICHGAAND